jgi:hypothetical protein
LLLLSGGIQFLVGGGQVVARARDLELLCLNALCHENRWTGDNMGTASRFNDIMKDELNIFAAWIPVTNTFQLGDYGLISDGVFVKIGNITTDHGVTFQSKPGPESKLDFTSKGTAMARFAGGTTVTAFPDQPIDAKLTIEFGDENSFLLKANLTVMQMQDINAVASKLAELPNWKNKYRVVSAVYNGKQCAMISSKAANSKIELSGKATALKQFELGAVSAELGVSNKKEIGLDLVGEDGVVGLSLFKLGWWDNSPKVLGPGENRGVDCYIEWPEK